MNEGEKLAKQLERLDREIEEWKRVTGGNADKATWLDRCAWLVVQGLINTHGPDSEPGPVALAGYAYDVAEAMLAEKRKREDDEQ